MYVYDTKIRVRKMDSDTIHTLLNNPKNDNDQLTACGLVVISNNWLVSLRDADCEECNTRYPTKRG